MTLNKPVDDRMAKSYFNGNDSYQRLKINVQDRDKKNWFLTGRLCGRVPMVVELELRVVGRVLGGRGVGLVLKVLICTNAAEKEFIFTYLSPKVR